MKSISELRDILEIDSVIEVDLRRDLFLERLGTVYAGEYQLWIKETNGSNPSIHVSRIYGRYQGTSKLLDKSYIILKPFGNDNGTIILPESDVKKLRQVDAKLMKIPSYTLDEFNT